MLLAFFADLFKKNAAIVFSSSSSCTSSSEHAYVETEAETTASTVYYTVHQRTFSVFGHNVLWNFYFSIPKLAALSDELCLEITE